MTNLPLLSDVAAAAEHCSYCPKMCRFACPVAEATGKESVTPWGIDRVISAMARGEQLTAEEQAPIWACTGCRQCGGACVPGLDLPTHVRAARAVAFADGAVPAGVEAAGGSVAAAAAALAAGATAGATTVVYPGCQSEGGDALGGILTEAGVVYDVVAEQTCCGARDADIGNRAAATERAAALRGQLAPAERVVVADPHCARWLGIDHHDERVTTVTSYLAELVAGLEWPAAPEPVTWHDPCWLGRGMAEYDEARAVVSAASGAEVLEPEHTRDRAWCAGGGMGYAQADPTGAAEILRRRAAELRATGASATVTACPTAAQRLRDAGLDAYDLPAYIVTRLRRSQT
jgi:Fe-S oxidoreductase